MRDPEYPDPSEFRYDESRLNLAHASSLTFDENYRLAQLPLVSPGHPLAIDHLPGQDYQSGRYEQARHSLVAPVSASDLESAGPYVAFARDVATSSFGGKISEELAKLRSDRLHVTIAGGLRAQDILRQAEDVKKFLRGREAFNIRVLGPFLGSKNRGRIYLPVVPERILGEQAFGLLQKVLGLPVSGFYAIGLLNFNDELDQAQTRDLHRVMEKWRHKILAEVRVSHLQMMATNDDLALSGRSVIDIFL
ncbi:MAG TPA: hypothetical protein VLL08_05640 [Kineosporiaceae bacterium]|nr:hypothetical protein [Kineosporiaceae bacterium]